MDNLFQSVLTQSKKRRRRLLFEDDTSFQIEEDDEDTMYENNVAQIVGILEGQKLPRKNRGKDRERESRKLGWEDLY